MTTRMTTLNDKNFTAEVTRSKKPVLVEVGSGRSGVSPVAAVGSHLRGAIKCCKINPAVSPTLVKKCKVQSLPTVFVYNQGTVTDTIVGDVKPEQLMGILFN